MYSYDMSSLDAEYLSNRFRYRISIIVPSDLVRPRQNRLMLAVCSRVPVWLANSTCGCSLS